MTIAAAGALTSPHQPNWLLLPCGAWQHTRGLPALVSNCSNNYDPYDFPERLIPLYLINILLGWPMPAYGDGSNVRDSLSMKDHCRALDHIPLAGEPVRTHCISGWNEVAKLVWWACSAH